MKTFARLVVFVTWAFTMSACSAPRNGEVGPKVDFVPRRSSPITMVQPQAHVYKIAPQWADLVPVVIADGRLVSYPAPSDVTASTAPIALSDGWWLDRQGIGPNTAFLHWSRQQYAALDIAPSPSEILAAVVPDAHIEDFRELPITTAQAVADTAEVVKMLSY